jgi:molybdopterin-guanine dinucleotide biosynthesis protein A
MSVQQPQVGGIVLCGGLSKRMGRPKALLPFGAELMAQRVVRLLREAVSPVAVVAAPEQAVPELPAGIQIVRDEQRGRGPLQGLAAGLAVLEGRVDAAYVSACDVPFLRPAFVRRLVELIGQDAICVPRIGDLYHPLAALYRLEVSHVVRDLLAADRLRPTLLFEAVPTRVVGPNDMADVDPTFQTLRNLNTPADYEAALQDLNAGMA